MRDDTRKYFDRAVGILNRMGIGNEDITVTGSVALDIMGVLPEGRGIHDFDCIVHAKGDARGRLRLLADIFRKDDAGEYSDGLMMDIGGTIINIWLTDGKDKSDMKYKGVGVKSLPEILDMKKEYGRSKDITDMYLIMQELFG